MSNIGLNNNVEANIIGTTIISTPEGKDPEYDVVGLVPNTLYFRLNSGDGNFNYIDANKISQSIKSIDKEISAKANASDLNVLGEEVSSNTSAINNRINGLQVEVDNKANKSEYDDFINAHDYALKSDLESLESKVDEKVLVVEDLESFKQSINDAITGEDSVFGPLEVQVEANKTSIAHILKDIEALQKVSSSLDDADTVEAIQNQISALETKLSKLISDNTNNITGVTTAVNGLNSSLNTLTGRVSGINNSLDKKASTVFVQTELNRVDDEIAEIKQNIDKKASIDQLTRKASKDELEVVSGKINLIHNTVGNRLDTLEQGQKSVSDQLSNKANKKDVDTEIAAINTALTNKVNAGDISKSINSLEKRIVSLEADDDQLSHEITCKLNSVETDLTAFDKKFTSLTNAHSTKLETQDAAITSLKSKDRDIENTLKNEWIRVMSPADYENLPKNPNYTNGTKNPNALQPNTIYFLMKYNKPYALYIGSVLIAKAEEKVGSTGFAYTFPIIF